MGITLSPRESAGATCPYCKDDVTGGPTCPRCGARYHEECALTFGRCAALGCGGALGPTLAPGVAAAFPRLRVVAHRLGQGRWSTEDLTEAGPFLVALFPAPREVEARPGAVAAVAQVLGQTAFDARMRLGANLPEPLARADDRAGADAVVARLGREGLPALAFPLARVLRPLAHVAAVGVRVGPAGAVVIEADGRERLLPVRPDGADDRLVVSAPFVEVRKWQEAVRAVPGGTGRYGGGLGGGGGSLRSKTASRERRARDPGALVFSPGDDVPVLLRASTLKRIEGLPRGPVAAQNFEQVLQALARGGQRVDLAGASDDALLSLRVAAMTPRGEQVTDNGRAVELAARLCYLRWMREQSGRAGRA